MVRTSLSGLTLWHPNLLHPFIKLGLGKTFLCFYYSDENTNVLLLRDFCHSWILSPWRGFLDKQLSRGSQWHVYLRCDSFSAWQLWSLPYVALKAAHFIHRIPLGERSPFLLYSSTCTLLFEKIHPWSWVVSSYHQGHRNSIFFNI